MNKIYTVESRVNAMRAYTKNLDAMSPKDAKIESIRALKESKVLNEAGNINPLLFAKSKYLPARD